MKIPILNNNYLNHAADSPFNVAFTIISVISSNLWYFSFLISFLTEHFLEDLWPIFFNQQLMPMIRHGIIKTCGGTTLLLWLKINPFDFCMMSEGVATTVAPMQGSPVAIRHFQNEGRLNPMYGSGTMEMISLPASW